MIVIRTLTLMNMIIKLCSGLPSKDAGYINNLA
jgi:hypothetical protein